jgi:two-component system OmpR family sensor kinase
VPLRTRLVLLLVALVAVALVATDAISFTSLQSSLISQLDEQLVTVYRSAQGPGTTCQNVPPGLYFRTFSAGAFPPARVLPCAPSDPPPVISASLVRSALKDGPQFASVPSASPDWGDYRVLVEPIKATLSPGEIAVSFSVPEKSVDSTLSHQFRLDLLVGIAVLVALALAAAALVRLSMRPLERMARTAGEIAAGDLSARIEHVDERTEVGQLGSSLNAMLTQIEQAFKGKEASEEQLRRFVGDASHELRTPLTSIRGYAELFRKGLADRPDDLAAAMRRIEAESVRMAGLVEDLLLLARLDQGRPLDFQPVDIVGLAQDAAADARAIDPGRIVTVFGPERLVVGADEQRLRQVFGNLVNNAVVHTPAGTPIELVVDGSDDAVSVAVVDHGPGIADSDNEHVFERFWRADRSRGRLHDIVTPSRGAGLGLSIVAAIVAAHGGTVSLHRTDGGGATFVVELPRGVSMNGETETVRRPEQRSEQPR